MRTRNFSRRKPINRLTVLTLATFLMTGVIGSRLFYLQVIKADYYAKKADKEHYGESTLPARRGEIFIKDYASNDLVRVATNTTLDLLYADPTLISDKKMVADRIAPMIFNLDDAKKADTERVKNESIHAKSADELSRIKPLTDQELYQKFYTDLLDKISQEKRLQITLRDDLTKEVLDQIRALNLTGIEVTDHELLAFPAQINNRDTVASALSPFMEMPPTELANILKGQNRYVVLQRKIKPEIAAKIKKIVDEDKTKNFSGLGLKEEYFRYYPEGTLSSNVLGFVTPGGIGQYGIESKFNTQLQGKKGVFKTQKDSIGRQITVGNSEIIPATDGDDIILTLDRSIQMTVEKILAQTVKDFNADNGQVIVMDPKTGKIMAMANYPTFNPNNFSEVYETEDIRFTEEEIKNLVPIENEPNNFWFYRNQITKDRIKIFRIQKDDGSVIYQKYKNTFGPEAYQNKPVSQAYEPGSIYKIITMAAALDDGDVTPSTSINDPGILYLDKNRNGGRFKGPDGQGYDAIIHNVSSKCTGHSNMSWIIQNSCNTGITWVAQKMGKSLFYSYMLKFGFNERTDIEFDNESPGRIAHYESPWTESEFANHAFGQGILVTPIQMVAAYAAIANNGIYMQPHIVESIQQEDGKTIKFEPKVVQRVISEDAATKAKAMLINNVENGDSYGKIRMPNRYLGAKTGTAQTYLNGQPLSGAGTTITTVIGFAPKDDPKFVILAKMDHPRASEWADATSAVLFNKVATYLFDYFSLPPDKK